MQFTFPLLTLFITLTSYVISDSTSGAGLPDTTIIPFKGFLNQSLPSTVLSKKRSIHSQFHHFQKKSNTYHTSSKRSISKRSTRPLIRGSKRGSGTFYAVGLGACGKMNNNNQRVVALSHALFDLYTPHGNPNRNSLCNKMITIHHNGRSTRVKVVDRCVACRFRDLDLSPSAFSDLAPRRQGRIKITWSFH